MWVGGACAAMAEASLAAPASWVAWAVVAAARGGGMGGKAADGWAAAPEGRLPSARLVRLRVRVRVSGERLRVGDVFWATGKPLWFGLGAGFDRALRPQSAQSEP